MTPTLPQGHVTILFTDMEESSRINDPLGNDMYAKELRDPHFALLRECIAAHNGHECGTPAGDSLMVVFQNPDETLACAKSMQEQLAARPISCAFQDTLYTARVRIGIHKSSAYLTPEDANGYGGTDTNFAKRIESLGAGEQIIVHESVQGANTWKRYRWEKWPNRRLKSFDHPETVYELLWDEGETRGEPGARWLPDWYRGERNRYIPRADKETEILAHFATKFPDGSPVRLVTLKGFGGMGKTRLGLACALQCVGLFNGNVVFVRLEDSEKSPEAVAEAIGTALGLQGEQRLPANLIAALREMDVLLLLDNYESVHCPDVQRFLRDLLHKTKKLRLLLTGREAVKIANLEQPVDIEGLTEPEARDLFLARAQLVRPGWQPVTPEEHAALASILRDTERIPLALELVAAGMGDDAYGSVELVAQSLADTPLPALPDGYIPADPSDRHESLTRCLDWSYNLLDPATQDGFARLGLFADTITPETAHHAAGVPDGSKLLTRLAQASLLKRVEPRTEVRYTLLRPTRAYAHDKLNVQTNADKLRHDYVVYYMHAVKQYADADNSDNLSIFDSELNNVLAASALAYSFCEYNAVCEAATLLNAYIHRRGKWAEGEQLNKLAIMAAQQSSSLVFERNARFRLASCLNKQKRSIEAIPMFQSCLEICPENKDDDLEINSLLGIGTAWLNCSEWNKAEQFYKQSLEVALIEENGNSESHIFGFLGCLYRIQNRLEEAEGYYERSLETRRANNILKGIEVTLNHLGSVYVSQGMWEKAEENFNESLRINHATGNYVRLGETLANFALLRKAQGNLKGSLALAYKAVNVLQSTQEKELERAVRSWIREWEASAPE